ncbi:magnesium transporter CorA family protein [Desulfosarcina sp. OttesenSCG-928-G10]|nr:magnesium transporter CorA family protein [Desulfosarcina sp. OttesenSCG-928-G10]MDL2320853.1 magnesium transporter CorA family protein [Desulfosarcina sp. OttesenSCG-928-B08]
MITWYCLDGEVPTPIPPLETGSPEETASTRWVHLTNPTEEERNHISARYRIPMDHLRAALDERERPRMEYDAPVLLVIARIPVQTAVQDDNTLHTPFRTLSAAIILTPEVVVTVCLKKDVIESMITRKMRGPVKSTGPRFLLNLLFSISTIFINHLRDLDQAVVDIEVALQKSMHNNELIRMLHIEKSLIYFLTALRGNHTVMEKLASTPGLMQTAEEREFLNDVMIENKQAADMAQIYTEIMGSIGDTFGAIVSNNLNKVMKLLAGLAIVFMIPGTIGALYGMNVPLPFQDNRLAFAGLCLLCILLSFLGYRILRKLEWI